MQDTLKKLNPVLQTFNYTGFVFLGCVMDTKPGGVLRDEGRKSTALGEPELCVVDFQLSPPDGFWAAFSRGLTMTMQNFLGRAVNPKSRPLAPFEFHAGVVCSRKLTLPPYPVTESAWLSPQDKLLLSKAAIPETIFRHERWGVYWNDVFKREDGDLQACGPLLGYAVGRGINYADAERDARNVALGLPIKYVQMKVDDSLAPYNIG